MSREARPPGKGPGGKRSVCPLALEQLETRRLPSTLQAISLPPANQPPSDTAAGASITPSVSADGRYVVFQSTARNLVAGQTGGAGNVFLLDRGTVQPRDRIAAAKSFVGYIKARMEQEKRDQAKPEPQAWTRIPSFTANRNMLAKVPAQRYEKPVEVAQALMPFIQPLQAKPGGLETPAEDVASPARGTVTGADTSKFETLQKVATLVPTTSFRLTSGASRT